jgi:AAA15 family ATPase/GTPase
MENFIHRLEIKNFKSIKHLKTDCKRVNVFIGKPNVGKSNILEAISLLGFDHTKLSETPLRNIIRYEEICNLFYDDDLQNRVEIHTNLFSAGMVERNDYAGTIFLFFDSSVGLKEIFSLPEISTSNLDQHFRKARGSELLTHGQVEIKMDGTQMNNRVSSDAFKNPIRKYHFSQIINPDDQFTRYLKPPFGPNLFTIVDQNKPLRNEIAEIFQEYGLQFVAYKKGRKFEIEKKVDAYVYRYPYSSIADTFQRLVFYYAVIDSNKGSILILEEPEVHSFPPYTKQLADRIIASKGNQFFLTTHSPYMLQNLVSDLDFQELGVYITYYENYQTKIKALSQADLKRVLDFGIDLYFNLDQFIGK